jgi:hypothetical protein
MWTKTPKNQEDDKEGYGKEKNKKEVVWERG